MELGPRTAHLQNISYVSFQGKMKQEPREHRGTDMTRGPVSCSPFVYLLNRKQKATAATFTEHCLHPKPVLIVLNLHGVSFTSHNSPF